MNFNNHKRDSHGLTKRDYVDMAISFGAIVLVTIVAAAVYLSFIPLEYAHLL